MLPFTLVALFLISTHGFRNVKQRVQQRDALPTSATRGHCCFHNGCESCDTDPTAYCNSNEGVCTGDCGGNWCGGGPAPTPTPTPTSVPTPPVPTPIPVSGTPVEQHGQLRVEGTKIVGEHGSPVQLRGMSTFWSQWSGQYWNADVVNWLADDWKVTLIRAAMGVDNDDGYMQNPAANKAKLEAVVQACIAKGLYVIIDWHDHSAEQHVGEARAFFGEMASKYGSYPNVLYETFNEPNSQSWAGVIKPYHEEVIPVIRAHTNNVIVLGTRTWSQEVDEACSNPVSGVNLAYTIHFYAATHKGSLRSKVQSALNMGCAVFATEWGTCDASGNGALDLAEARQWISFFDQNNIGHANWAINDKDESASAMRPGASGGGGWSDDTLTPSGSWVRDMIRGGSAPTPGGSPTPGSGQGCCKFGADCGDCGEDGTGWCHESASNCALCTGTFDPSAAAPACVGEPPAPTPTLSPTPTSAPTPPVPTPLPVSGSPVEQHGQLRVEGTKIVGEHGSPVQLRGMSMFWSQWSGEYWNADVVNWLADDWKVTMIRAAMGVDSDDGYMQDPVSNKAWLEAVVQACIAKGIYVVIDWHDHSAEQHVNEAKAFFSEMASKYGGHPNTLFETYNEPIDQSWTGVIKPYHEQVIPVIRAHTNNIITLGNRKWSQEVDEACRNPVSGVNLVYTIHFYAQIHGQELRNKVQSAINMGCPIFCSEWGTGFLTLDLGSAQAWLDFFEPLKISSANWGVYGKDGELNAALAVGASPGGGWSSDQLTESGRWVRNYIRGEGVPTPSGGGGGCCKFGADCGDCGEDGTGWCHQSVSNCAVCTGTFDSGAPAPSCR